MTAHFLRIGVVLVSLTASCTRRAPAPTTEAAGGAAGRPINPKPPAPLSFEAHSEIPDCVRVTAVGERVARNLLLGTVRLETRKIIADCICPSKWLMYRAIRTVHGYRAEQASGILLAPDPGTPGRDLDIVLQSDTDHPEEGALTVVLDCRPPL